MGCFEIARGFLFSATFYNREKFVSQPLPEPHCIRSSGIILQLPSITAFDMFRGKRDEVTVHVFHSTSEMWGQLRMQTAVKLREGSQV